MCMYKLLFRDKLVDGNVFAQALLKPKDIKVLLYSNCFHNAFPFLQHKCWNCASVENYLFQETITQSDVIEIEVKI